MIPKLVDKTSAANSGKWAAPTTDMLEDVNTLTLDAVKEYTSDTLKFDKANGTGRQDQHWLLKLIHNSCLSDLRDIVDKTFNKLPVHQQGGSVYLKLIYDVVFNMTEPVQSMVFTRSQARMSTVRLHEVDVLPSDAAMDILTGLTKATNNDFTRPFKLLKDLSNQSIIELGHLKSKTTLERIKTYLSQALDSYVVHVVNSTWKIKAIHAFTSELTCWNCGKHGHDLRSCPEPRNQDRIDKARASYRENKKPGTSKPGGSGGGGSGYSRGKFGKPPARGETVRFINDKPHAWCGSCGWTTSHSTKSHDDWNANKSTFVLHDQHPLTIAKQGSGKNGAQLKSKSKSKSKSNKSESDADTSGGLSLAALGEHFAKMETSASDPTQANMAQLLKNLLQGKV